MKLREMKIERPVWGENKDKVVGVIKFEGDHGNITLQLTEDHCQQILMLCADAIVESAKQSAMQLAGAVVEATSRQIEAPPAPLTDLCAENCGEVLELPGTHSEADHRLVAEAVATHRDLGDVREGHILNGDQVSIFDLFAVQNPQHIKVQQVASIGDRIE